MKNEMILQGVNGNGKAKLNGNGHSKGKLNGYEILGERFQY